MIQIRCPWCGPRGAAEFHYAGEVTVRPDPASVTPRQWRAYLYFPANPLGQVRETWYHRAGCRRYFTADRDTSSNQFLTGDEGAQ
jgi:heterotetrameric sarcosine oxidase delta subunit